MLERKILFSSFPSLLSRDINQHILQGWELEGNLCTGTNSTYQMMSRDSKYNYDLKEFNTLEEMMTEFKTYKDKNVFGKKREFYNGKYYLMVTTEIKTYISSS